MEERDVPATKSLTAGATGPRSPLGARGAWYWFVFTYQSPALLAGQEVRTR